MFLLTVLLSLKQFEGKHVFIFLVVLQSQIPNSSCIRFVAAGVEKEKEGEKNRRDTTEDKFVAFFSRRCLLYFWIKGKKSSLIFCEGRDQDKSEAKSNKEKSKEKERGGEN